MESKKTDFWVGVFVVTGLTAILFLALQAANLLGFQWNTTYPVVAKFDNIGGLKARAAVKSSGVVVGRVEHISLDTTDYQARVELALDQRFQFPKDSSFKILTSGLLGEQYIGIEAGVEGEVLKAGETASQTGSAIVLENLISQFLFNKAAEPPAAASPAASQPSSVTPPAH